MFNQQQNEQFLDQTKIVIEERAPVIQVLNNSSINFSNCFRQGQSVAIRRPETSEFNYDFGYGTKYTEKITEIKDNFCSRKSEFSLNNVQIERCAKHAHWKNYILTQDVPPFPKFTVMCQVCYEELRRQNGGRHFGELYLSLIHMNGEKINQIRNNQISFSTYTNAYVSSKFVHESLLPLADELIHMTETFEENVVSKICGVRFSEEDILMLKNWINAIQLDANNNPKTDKIGDNEELMKNYVKLAVFLSTFEGLGTQVVDNKELTQNLKNYLLRLVQLRKLIVLRITDWIKYLTGDFYKFLFSIEGIQIDYNFIQNLIIEFEGENSQEVLLLREEIRRKDITIVQLRDENELLKRKISENEMSFKEDWEEKYWDIQKKNEKLHIEINNYLENLENFRNENNHLIEVNMSLNNRIIVLQQEIKNFEIRLRNECTITINNLKIEWENLRERIIRERDIYWEQRIIVIREQSDCDWKIKYEEINKKYILIQEQLNILNVRINNYIIEINRWRDEYERQLTIVRELEQKLIIIREEKKKVEYIEKTVYVERPVENIVEKFITEYVDRPYNVVKTVINDVIEVINRPVEKIIYVDKPYPVREEVKVPYEVIKIEERIKEVLVPYEVVKIEERIREVPVPYEVIKIEERIREVPVPYEVKVPYQVFKIEERIKEVPVPYEVVKVEERIREVPVPYEVKVLYEVIKVEERIKEVPVPYEVKVPYEVIKVVERIKEVAVPYEVVKIEERIREVPVPYEVVKIEERIREVPVPYEVKVPYEVIKEVPYEVIKVEERIKEVPVPYEVVRFKEIERIVVKTKIHDVVQIVDRPVEFKVEVPVPYETIVERVVIRTEIRDVIEIVERPIEIRIEVPVEKIVEKVNYIEKPYVVKQVVEIEKITGKIVEKPYEVIKEIPMPYPVEKTVYVDKIVVRTHIKDVIQILDRPVEVRVEVPVPYEVEKVVYVDKIVEKVIVKTEIIDILEEVVNNMPPEIIREYYPVKEVVEIVIEVIKTVEKPYPVNYVKTIVKDIVSEKIKTVVDETEIHRLREEIHILKQRISTMTIDITSWNSEWEKLHSTYLILIEEIKRQVAMNEFLSTTIIELESNIEKYNNNIVGSESYIKQQLEILARSSLKNQSIAYISHKKEAMETQSELFNLRQKIGRIEAIRFNNSFVHQRININTFEENQSQKQLNYVQQNGKSFIEKSFNSLDFNNSVNVAPSGQNKSFTKRNTIL